MAAERRDGKPSLRVAIEEIRSYEDFVKFRGSRKDEPILLRNAAFNRPADGFTLESVAEALKDLKLPQKSLSAKQGGNASQCTLLVANQGQNAVIDAKPDFWDPQGCSFGILAEKICKDKHYLTTRSGKGRVKRVGDVLCYDKVEDEDRKDVLVESFLERAPFPLLLEDEAPFQVAYWMGSTGNNFGLHTDMFTEQFLCQHQGTKEVLLLLPEDASLVDPFPFLETTLYYKSRSRSVKNLHPGAAREVLRIIMQPGDVLYMPSWWWHEVRTLEGPSCSTTYRFHLEDADRFLKVMNLFYQFHKSAAEYGTGHLAKHLRSFFVHALQPSKKTGEGWFIPLVSCTLGFGFGWLCALRHRCSVR